MASSTEQQRSAALVPDEQTVVTETKRIIASFPDREGIVIPVLQAIQKRFGYVPESAVPVVAQELGRFPAELYGILTFYAQFSIEPKGRHVIRVCQGTACYVMGGKALLDELSERLQVPEGATTEDGNFTLETVACLGCCGMAPVIVVDEDFYGNVTMKKLDEILAKYDSGDTPTADAEEPRP